MYSYLSHEYLDKTLTRIIRVMKEIKFTTLLYSIKIKLENLVHEFHTICYESLMSCPYITAEKIHVYHQNKYDKDQLMRLTWYHQNPCFLMLDIKSPKTTN